MPDPERCSAGHPGLIWTIKKDKKEPAPVQDKAHGKPVLFDYGIKSCYKEMKELSALRAQMEEAE